MGGQAFANIKSDTPINVPRLPPAAYERVVADVQTKLESLFNRVTIPREAPGKLDYGDVDFLVEGIQSTNHKDIWATIKSLLGAKLHISRGGSSSFGIEHPYVPDAYVQVDVEISPGNGTPDGAELFEWTRFMKGDSDLLQIIGVCHRPLGLTCNDRGLHVRVQEIEPYNKKKSLIYLTRHPDEALEFYGLDVAKYREGFRDETDLFDFVSKGRFFSWEVFNSRTENSNDRSRQSKRAMYRRFVENYMPAHVDAGTVNVWTREEVLKEALDRFGKHDEYQAMLAECNAKEAEETLWKQIRESLPVEGPALSLSLKGLKRWVDFNDGQPYITAQALEKTPIWTDAISRASTDDVVKWATQNWREVKALEKRRGLAAKEAAHNSVDAEQSANDPSRPSANT
ncbi:hypothetical protein BU26DRAFT_63936 [Trematosphaeria pertusa]|uniref:Uncharacterized protein n=1 Tax=Trematosphaeria pertusa TaxID=390896 RepID=A0A6A6I9I8_9PLEO|nr:uncharacterized protein BU26DRAFT_63936 [Trematosphaeria pertusa]KAF2246180.1 hypothetical protein BU26DRAFT_63936 [Trematosphaeria pertusa]